MSFPGLINLADQLGDIKEIAFTQQDLTRLGWDSMPDECLISKYLDMVLDGSSKFEYLRGMINERCTDYWGRLEKFLIITKQPVMVFILSVVSLYSVPDPLLV